MNGSVVWLASLYIYENFSVGNFTLARATIATETWMASPSNSEHCPGVSQSLRRRGDVYRCVSIWGCAHVRIRAAVSISGCVSTACTKSRSFKAHNSTVRWSFKTRLTFWSQGSGRENKARLYISRGETKIPALEVPRYWPLVLPVKIGPRAGKRRKYIVRKWTS